MPKTDQVSLFCFYDTAFDGNAAYLGFPCAESSKSAFVPSALIGMSSSSTNTSKSAEFLNFILSDYCQTGTLISGLPVLQSALQSRIEFWVSDYEQFPKSMYTYYDGLSVTIEGSTAPTTARDQVYNLINSANVLARSDPDLLSLIITECQSYFYGVTTSSQAVEHIQSKASIYLAEKKDKGDSTMKKISSWYPL